MSPLEAWLYLDRMELSRYWPDSAGISWEDFRTQFEEGKTSLEDCDFLSPPQRHAFRIALEPQGFLPSVPSIDVPQPIAPDLFPLNEPGPDAMVLVTANSSLTFDLMGTIWSLGLTPAYLLLVDCLGSTVDMAIVYGTFTADRLAQALAGSGIETMVSHRRLTVPGLASPLAAGFREATGWDIDVGPVCAAEIPLYLGDRWIPPDA